MTDSITPTPEEIAAIAKKLTPQMVSAITWPKEPMIVPNTLYSATIAGLERRGIVNRHYALTTLGTALKTHLLSQENPK